MRSGWAWLAGDSAPPVESGRCAAFVDKQADRAATQAGGARVPAIESVRTQCGVGHPHEPLGRASGVWGGGVQHHHHVTGVACPGVLGGLPRDDVTGTERIDACQRLPALDRASQATMQISFDVGRQRSHAGMWDGFEIGGPHPAYRVIEKSRAIVEVTAAVLIDASRVLVARNPHGFELSLNLFHERGRTRLGGRIRGSRRCSRRRNRGRMPRLAARTIRLWRAFLAPATPSESCW